MHVANIIINKGGEISLPVSCVSPSVENLNNLTACKFVTLQMLFPCVSQMQSNKSVSKNKIFKKKKKKKKNKRVLFDLIKVLLVSKCEICTQ